MESSLQETLRGSALPPGPSQKERTMILLVGTSYKLSTIDFREALARDLKLTRNWLTDATKASNESAVLSTCNRLEAYLVTNSPEESCEAIFKAAGRTSGVARPRFAFEVLEGPAVVHHLFRVSSGLESVVLGEPQILAQVRAAGVASRRNRSAKGILSPLFDRAVRVGARARTSYGLGNEEKSLSDLAVSEVLQCIPPRGSVMLIGTGKMVHLASSRLKGKTGKLYIASRRRQLPKGMERATLVRYSDIPRTARRCDAIISATSANRPMILAQHLKGGKSKVVVDLGMPRNVSGSVRELSNVRLLDLDDMAKLAGQSRVRVDLSDAEKAASREASEFYSWLVRTRLSSTLSDIYEWAEETRRAELKRARGRMKLTSERDRKVLDAMSRRIVSKLLARPANFAHSRQESMTEEEKLELLRSVFGMGDDHET